MSGKTSKSRDALKTLHAAPATHASTPPRKSTRAPVVVSRGEPNARAGKIGAAGAGGCVSSCERGSARHVDVVLHQPDKIKAAKRDLGKEVKGAVPHGNGIAHPAFGRVGVPLRCRWVRTKLPSRRAYTPGVEQREARGQSVARGNAQHECAAAGAQPGRAQAALLCIVHGQK